MKKVVFNDDNLSEEEMDVTINKVRGIILNAKGQILLCKYAGVYLLPGGSIDEGETEKEAFKREIYEETGIEIDEEIEKFLEIQTFNKNYYERRLDKKINRITNTSFYVAQTLKEIDWENRKLTESEEKNGFSIFYTNLSRIEYLISSNDTANPKKAIFDRELLTVIKEFAKYRETDNTKEGRE